MTTLEMKPDDVKRSDQEETKDPLADSHRNIWQSIRSKVMFGLAVLTSPCCAVLLVPILISLFGGTAIASFLSQYIGWVYGILTAISIVSLGLALRWMLLNSRAPIDS